MVRKVASSKYKYRDTHCRSHSHMVQLMVKPSVKGHVTPMSILVDVNIDHDR